MSKKKTLIPLTLSFHRADKTYSDQLERRLSKLPAGEQERIEAMIVTLCGVKGLGRESALDVIFKMFRTMRDQKRAGLGPPNLLESSN